MPENIYSKDIDSNTHKLSLSPLTTSCFARQTTVSFEFERKPTQTQSIVWERDGVRTLLRCGLNRAVCFGGPRKQDLMHLRYGLGGKSSPMSSLNWIFDNNNMKDSTAIVSDDDISTDYDDE